MVHPASRFSLILLTVFALLPSGSTAADVEFHPEISVEAEYTDNVTVQPGDSGESDLISRLRILLPVIRKWDSGSFEFRYAPAYESYRDTGYLDTDTQALTFALVNNISPKADLNLDFGYDKSVQQAGADSVNSADLILSGPLDRERAGLLASYRRQFTRRWSYKGEITATEFRYDTIPGTVPGSVGQVADRSEWGAALSFDHILSQQSTLGVLLRHGSNELDTNGSEDIDELAAVWTRNLGQPGDRIMLSLGAANRTGEFLPPGGLLPVVVDETEFSVNASLVKSLRRSNWTLVASRAPSSGGISAVATTDTLAGAIYSFTPNPYWSGSVQGRYVSRDPVGDSIESTDALAFGAGVEWRPTPRFGYRLGADHSNQSGMSGFEDTTVTRGWFGLVWYPRGPQGGSGRSAG